MFESYAIQNNWQSRSPGIATRLVSFGFQAFALVALLIASLLHPEGLPHLSLLGPVLTTTPLAPPASVVRTAAGSVFVSAGTHPLLLPSRIPTVPTSGDDSGTTSIPTGPGVPGSIGDGLGNNVLEAIGERTPPVIPASPPVRPSRVSRMMEGNLIYRVQPEYPALAREARVQGVVVLRAVIDRDGIIQNLKVVSGPPLLVHAAMSAVRQWRYRPFYLNDQPVEVETQVTVNFTLGGR